MFYEEVLSSLGHMLRCPTIGIDHFPTHILLNTPFLIFMVTSHMPDLSCYLPAASVAILFVDEWKQFSVLRCVRLVKNFAVTFLSAFVYACGSHGEYQRTGQLLSNNMQTTSLCISHLSVAEPSTFTVSNINITYVVENKWHEHSPRMHEDERNMLTYQIK
jgi:hypothetical protein